MVVVNHGLTKGVILVPCSKTIDANGIAQLFFDHVFKRFGLHDTLISDRGPQFASAFAKELARLLRYNPCLYPSLGKTFLPALETRFSSLDLARKEALAAHESARQIMIEQSS